jgi:hypothetical protein
LEHLLTAKGLSDDAALLARKERTQQANGSPNQETA